MLGFGSVIAALIIALLVWIVAVAMTGLFVWIAMGR